LKADSDEKFRLVAALHQAESGAPAEAAAA
jgi:hypothetical protein